MSGITAADFFLLGVMISLLDVKARWSHGLQGMFAAMAAVASMFGILDFVLDPEKTHTHIAPLTALILFSACSDPSANKSKAVTGEAAPIASPSAAARGQKYVVTPQNSKLESRAVGPGDFK